MQATKIKVANGSTIVCNNSFHWACNFFLEMGAILLPSRYNSLNLVAVLGTETIAEVCHPNSIPLS